MSLKRLNVGMELAANCSVVAIAALLLWTQFVKPATAGASLVEEMAPVTIRGEDVKYRLGEAKFIVVEFGDFECPYCGKSALTTLPSIKDELIKTGQASYAFMHFPIESGHKFAFKASEAAECAGDQGRYWDMHALLFANQKQLAVADLLRYGQALDIDMPSFEKCLQGEMADRVRLGQREGSRLGITGTPASFVGTIADDGSIQLTRVLRGAVPFQSVKDAVMSVATPSNSWWKLHWPKL